MQRKGGKTVFHESAVSLVATRMLLLLEQLKPVVYSDHADGQHQSIERNGI